MPGCTLLITQFTPRVKFYLFIYFLSFVVFLDFICNFFSACWVDSSNMLIAYQKDCFSMKVVDAAISFGSHSSVAVMPIAAEASRKKIQITVHAKCLSNIIDIVSTYCYCVFYILGVRGLRAALYDLRLLLLSSINNGYIL